MGTLNQKLDKLKLTKSQIKAAIINKGGTVADTDTFANYSIRISAIPQSSDYEKVTFAQTGYVNKVGHFIASAGISPTDYEKVTFTTAGNVTIQS